MEQKYQFTKCVERLKSNRDSRKLVELMKTEAI